ncbi:hypothetical protein EVAR_85998_1 [Eumeta japonica]|uniref:Uncharacterized protein n=1 Tax=Eumeta variegata TaxID=151549 RepID=A0A4C1UKJ4_EUMVA|nr:hypothetical protein EVAR_85998_1 [Eumeta japonica]
MRNAQRNDESPNERSLRLPLNYDRSSTRELVQLANIQMFGAARGVAPLRCRLPSNKMSDKRMTKAAESYCAQLGCSKKTAGSIAEVSHIHTVQT